MGIHSASVGNCRAGTPRIDDHHLGAPLPGLHDAGEVQRRAVGRGIRSPYDNEIRVLQVREHVDHHSARGHVRSDHRKGYVAEGAHAQGIRRSKGEQDARRGRYRYPLRLENIALGLFETSSPRVYGCGFRPIRFPNGVEPGDDDVKSLVPRNACELIPPLWTGPEQRMTQPIR